MGQSRLLGEKGIRARNFRAVDGNPGDDQGCASGFEKNRDNDFEWSRSLFGQIEQARRQKAE